MHPECETLDVPNPEPHARTPREKEMKLTKMLGVAAVTAMALMAFASTASATTLSTNGGTPISGAVTLEASLTTNTTALLSDTTGALANTCTRSNFEGTTSSFSGTTVSGPVSILSFTGCTFGPAVLHHTGTFRIEVIATGPSGTVGSSGAEVTVPTGLFGTVNCKTNSITDLGTLIGSTTGTAEIDINTVLTCGFFLPSARWNATYVLTVPGTTTEERHHISVVA